VSFHPCNVSIEIVGLIWCISPGSLTRKLEAQYVGVVELATQVAMPSSGTLFLIWGLKLSFKTTTIATTITTTWAITPNTRFRKKMISKAQEIVPFRYMHFHRIIPIDEGDIIICEQGYAFGMKPRPSKISVQLFFDPVDPAPVSIPLLSLAIVLQTSTLS